MWVQNDTNSKKRDYTNKDFNSMSDDILSFICCFLAVISLSYGMMTFCHLFVFLWLLNHKLWYKSYFQKFVICI